VVQAPVRVSGTSGNFIREVDVGVVTGTLPAGKGGTQTSVITIITDHQGNLVNTFPGTLGRGASF
jgi:filamentous hemagglutinin